MVNKVVVNLIISVSILGILWFITSAGALHAGARYKQQYGSNSCLVVSIVVTVIEFLAIIGFCIYAIVVS